MNKHELFSIANSIANPTKLERCSETINVIDKDISAVANTGKFGTISYVDMTNYGKDADMYIKYISCYYRKQGFIFEYHREKEVFGLIGYKLYISWDEPICRNYNKFYNLNETYLRLSKYFKYDPRVSIEPIFYPYPDDKNKEYSVDTDDVDFIHIEVKNIEESISTIHTIHSKNNLYYWEITDKIEAKTWGELVDSIKEYIREVNYHREDIYNGEY